MLKVTNIVTNEITEVKTKKGVAEFIAESGVTENSIKTIQKKIVDGAVLYETFKIEEEEIMTNKNKIENLEETITEEKIEEIVNEETVEEISEQQTEPTAKEKTEEEEPKKDKRKTGKGIIAYKNGKEFMRFPSIKSTAQYFKDLKELGHMPFTPIMKSVRQGIDWEEYSFKHEKDEDLHIPESLKIKLSKQQDNEKNEEKQDETPQEPIEEIVEIPQETL